MNWLLLWPLAAVLTTVFMYRHAVQRGPAWLLVLFCIACLVWPALLLILWQKSYDDRRGRI